MKREHAIKIREMMHKAAVSLNDGDALEAVELFSTWKDAGQYAVGDRVRHEGILYKCLQAHTAQTDWTPANAVSLWAKVLIPDPGVIPEWEQPESTNPYMQGDKVRHNEKIWISTIDYNVYEPGVYGWEVTE